MKLSRYGVLFLAISILAVLSSCSSPTTPTTTGTIQVSSTPTGASVFLDGTDKSLVTNCTLTNIPTGSHTVKLVKAGYVDHQGTVTVSAGRTTTFSATLTAVTTAALSVTPASGLTSSGPVGGPFAPASQDYTLQNTGGAALDWTAAATQAWVTVSPLAGNLAAGATVTVTVSINAGANALAAGAHNDTVTFTNTTNAVGNTTRPVSLTIAGAAALAVTPAGGLTSTGNVGGPFTPSSQAYTLQNTGGTALAWTAAATQAWVTVSPLAGNLAAGAMATVTVSINAGANALAAGAHNDTVTFTNTTNAVGNTTRPVSLTVTGPGALAVTPAAGFTPNGNVGGPFTPSSQAYTLQNTGGTALNWTAAATQAWVTVSPLAGNLAAGAMATVTVSVNAGANSLAAGVYNDSVTFTNTTNAAGNTSRPVSLSVTSGTTFISVTVDYSRVLPIPSPGGSDFPVVSWTYAGGNGTRGMAKVVDDVFTSPNVAFPIETIITIWVTDLKMDNGVTSRVCRTIMVNGQLIDVGTTIYGEATFIIGSNGIIRRP